MQTKTKDMNESQNTNSITQVVWHPRKHELTPTIGNPSNEFIFSPTRVR